MIEVVMSSKEIDSENTLESSHELWIYAQEWKKYGVRLLREKSIFIWCFNFQNLDHVKVGVHIIIIFN